jgi:hypothetical protein
LHPVSTNRTKAYDILATPAAFLIVAENGMIAKNPAVGKDAILALVHNGRAWLKGGTNGRIDRRHFQGHCQFRFQTGGV